MFDNIILLTDSYKASHYLQYPENTQNIYSYFESRGGIFQKTMFFGLQYYLKKYLSGEVVTKEKIEKASKLYKLHFGNDLFNKKGWQYIVDKHKGKLPVSIKAVPEGTMVPVSNVLMTIENTDPNCYWLTNYLETLLVQVWYGSSVATQSKEMKNVLLKYLHETGDPWLADFKLHDFGFRGVSSVETAGIGGCAHLVNFKGTDTVVGLEVANEIYGCEMAGFSIPAAEHSTITSWGKSNESQAYENMLDKFSEGLVAVVSDSYDIFNACINIWGEKLKKKVLGRKGTLIIRPDSGEPTEIIPQLLKILGCKFGEEINKKGYKVLNSHIRIIQGDGIDRDSLPEILEAVKNTGYSTDNIAFGSGGGLLQKLNRDTSKYAFKCSHAVVNGAGIDVYKDPITDHGKKSKTGRLKLIVENNEYKTVSESTNGEDRLVEVFRNGNILKNWNFDIDVRANAN